MRRQQQLAVAASDLEQGLRHQQRKVFQKHQVGSRRQQQVVHWQQHKVQRQQQGMRLQQQLAAAASDLGRQQQQQEVHRQQQEVRHQL
jgi:hypothetical protein